MSPTSEEGGDTAADVGGTAGDWVCCCTEGLEDVTLDEVAQLGGSARVIGDGVVLVSAASMVGLPVLVVEETS